MTVSSEVIRKSYAGDDSTTVFQYTWKIYAETDLLVVERDDTTLEETPKVLTTDYTVSGVGDANGGNVTMLVAPASGKTLVIKLDLPFTQLTDWVENDDFPADSHEDAADRVVKMAQILNEKLDRALLLPVSSSLSGLELPEKTGDAKYFSWNEAGDTIVLGTPVALSLFELINSIVTLTGYELEVRKNGYPVIMANGTSMPAFVCQRQSGTLESPGTLSEGDIVGRYEWMAWEGAVHGVFGTMDLVVTAGANFPTYFRISTRNTTGTLNSVLVLDHQKNIILNSIGQLVTTDGVGIFIAKNADTTPTTSPADGFQMYSADQAAGNACPHFRTEGGHVIKLYQQAHIDDPTDLATCITAIGSILDALEALGLLATS